MMDNYLKLKEQGLVRLENIDVNEAKLVKPIYNSSGEECDCEEVTIHKGIAIERINAINEQKALLETLLINYTTLQEDIQALDNE